MRRLRTQVPDRTKITPKRIFLSYGHDEHFDLAERIKEDLTRRGHEVWFDADRLNPGVNWEARIEQGLDWVADDRDRGCLLLLMTPHSVRRPDGYCLNEVAFAVYKRITIIPVMVKLAMPPLSICRTQWFDMTDCIPLIEKLDRYETKFQLLAKALEENCLDFEGSLARLHSLLSPLKFDYDIGRHLPNFIGRQWVFDEIKAWLAKSPAPRIFLLTGEPGIGKTAISAWSCQRLSVAAFHLCQHELKDKRDPRKCVLSIAYQLSTQLPDYQRHLIDTHNLEELVKGSDAVTLFDNIVVQPLYEIQSRRSDQPVLVLIDALDEASEGGTNELADFIASEFPKTPDWLRLLITSRPQREVLQPLQSYYQFDIGRSVGKNQEDIQAYLASELKPYFPSSVVPQATITTIASRSEGIFLYVKLISEELKLKRLSIDNLDEFPQGLGGHYYKFFKRQYPDMDAYKKRFRPVLEAIAAANEPLEIATIAHLFNWDINDQNEIADSLGAIFPGRSDHIQPFHRSVVDWLTDASRAGLYLVNVSKGHRCLADYGWQIFIDDHAKMPDYFKHYLPQHLIALQRWEQLEKVLCDLNLFEYIYEKGRKYEWMRYWQSAREHCDPGRGYQTALKDIEERESEHLRIAHLTHLIGSFLRDMGMYDLALPFMEQSQRLQESVVGAYHPDIAPIVHDLAEFYRVQHTFDKALPLYERALHIRQDVYGPDSSQVATSLHDLAEFYHDQKQYERALQYYQDALRIREHILPENEPAIADCLNDIGALFHEQYKFDDALQLFQRALDIYLLSYGTNHPDTAAGFHNIGNVYLEKEQYDLARPLLQRSLSILENILAPHHPKIQICRNTLARLYEAQGEYERAEPLRWQALKAKELVLGSGHQEVIQSKNNLVVVLEAQGQVEKLLSRIQNALKMEEAAVNPSYETFTDLMNILALRYYNQGKVAEAMEISKQSLAAQEHYLGPFHLAISITLVNLGYLYDALGRQSEAQMSYQRAAEIRENSLGREHHDVMAPFYTLGWSLFKLSHYESAESVFRQALGIREKTVGDDHIETAEILNSVVRCLQENGDHSAAMQLCRRALDIRERKLGLRHENIATSLNNLGLSLVCLAEPGQSEELREAEQHLLRAIDISPQSPFAHY